MFWVDFFGALENDRLLIRLVAPDGSVLAETGHRFRRSKAQYFRFVGKRRRADPWPPGAYRGEFVLIRRDDGGGRRVLDVTRTLRVE